MDSIRLKTKELVTYYCGCHGNLVTIATRYVVDAYCPKEPPYQIWNEYNLRKGVTKQNVFDSDSLTQTHRHDSLTYWTRKSGQLNFTECRVTTLQAR